MRRRSTEGLPDGSIYSCWTEVIIDAPKYPQKTLKYQKFDVSKMATLTCTTKLIKIKIILAIARGEPTDIVIRIFIMIFVAFWPV